MTTTSTARPARSGNRPPAASCACPPWKCARATGGYLYSFAIDGKQLPRFAAVSRIHRDDDAEIEGYQRPEVLSHIASIRRYLESETPMIPNALVIAFDKRVQFVPLRGAPSVELRAARDPHHPGRWRSSR